MLAGNIKSRFKNIQTTLALKYNAAESLKIYMIYLFIFIGFVVLFGLGLKGLTTSNPLLTVFLLGGSLLLVANFFYLRKTRNDTFSGSVILYLFFTLMLYLVYTGGVDHTGPLWIYCLPPLSLSVLGLRKGVLNLTIFLFIISLMLFYPHPDFLDTTYTFPYKIRIVFSFIVVVILSLVYEYFHELSSKRMSELKKDLEFSIRHDELTGLYNRRGYQDKVNTHTHEHSFTAILMCDIDCFKDVNDKYGHSAGDLVIQKVADCLKNNIRKDDIAVRWGGEEFLIFLSHTSINNAYLLSEKLRESIASTCVDYEGTEICFTVSLGIAPLDNSMTLEHAISNADKAMYLSKSLGRNKTSRH